MRDKYKGDRWLGELLLSRAEGICPVIRFMGMRRMLVVLLFLCIHNCIILAQHRNVFYEKYINQYSHLAIQARDQYRIPASITLAQALLESAAGQSVLARNANNHFGIKCHGWSGGKYYADDDAPNECFRKYKRVEDSYTDHSLFLANRDRYAGLFKLKTTDYEHWARGLQKSGYATDRKYGEKLIDIIEFYELHRYDKVSGDRAKVKDFAGWTSSYELRWLEKLRYVESTGSDSFASIGLELNIKPKRLAKYNELPVDAPLRRGDRVYLQKKKSRAPKPYLMHRVESGESMYSISQRYGVRLKSLYKLNRRGASYVPVRGDIVLLR